MAGITSAPQNSLQGATAWREAAISVSWVPGGPAGASLRRRGTEDTPAKLSTIPREESPPSGRKPALTGLGSRESGPKGVHRNMAQDRMEYRLTVPVLGGSLKRPAPWGAEGVRATRLRGPARTGLLG